ncbi:MAG: hypothetical protein F4X50_09275 [Synechococcus sp. SB0662_bin_14]|nr:hypothetical protein [Synechococcus sp. SB0662_bin_14]
MPFDDLINVIEACKERIRVYRQSLQQNETRTRVALIDPLLTALGWDVSDPGLVTPEYSVGQRRADYALNGSDAIPAAMVEAKRLNYALNEDERMQMLNYANARGVRYAAVTDGDIWELYEVFKYATLEDRRLLSVKITSTPAHQLALQLLLLWRPNLASGAPVPAQEPVLGTRREPAATTEVFHPPSHPPVDTPLVQQPSSAPTSATTHQPKQQRSSRSFKAQYCVDGQTWRECPNATDLMLSIVEWCGQQHRDGADNYYENLSHICLRGDRPILVKERVTEVAERWYSGKEVNGWYIFNNLNNSAKREMIEEILRACIRQNGTSPVPDRDVQVKMPND